MKDSVHFLFVNSKSLRIDFTITEKSVNFSNKICSGFMLVINSSYGRCPPHLYTPFVTFFFVHNIWAFLNKVLRVAHLNSLYERLLCDFSALTTSTPIF